MYHRDSAPFYNRDPRQQHQRDEMVGLPSSRSWTDHDDRRILRDSPRDSYSRHSSFSRSSSYVRSPHLSSSSNGRDSHSSRSQTSRGNVREPPFRSAYEREPYRDYRNSSKIRDNYYELPGGGTDKRKRERSFSPVSRDSRYSPTEKTRYSPTERTRYSPTERTRYSPTPSKDARYSPSERTRYSPTPPADKRLKTSSGNNYVALSQIEKYEEIPVSASGRDCPKPISDFRDVDLGHRLLENILRANYDKPTPIQKHSLPIVLNGRDLMACAQTGSGKTAAFLLPIISTLTKRATFSPKVERTIHGIKALPSALILAPTRELVCQIHSECSKFAFRTGISSLAVYGGTPIRYQIQRLEGGVDIIAATPGRLLDLMKQEKICLSHIQFLVLDEADRMLDMGFEPQIREVIEKFDMAPKQNRQTLMFSATFPKEIQKLASSFLQDYIFVSVGRIGSTTDLVTQKFIQVPESGKDSTLIQLLRQDVTPGLTLIFVETKKKAESLSNLLQSMRLPVASIHGDRNQRERNEAIRNFSNKRTPILVATNVAARGLDINDIDHVINYDMPGDIDDYVHRIGRTGRAGKTGIATAFITPENTKIAVKLLEILNESNQEIPPWLDQMKMRAAFLQQQKKFSFRRY